MPSKPPAAGVGQGSSDLREWGSSASRRGASSSRRRFRRREWAPAIEAPGVARPARIYGLRATFASRALAADVSVFELAGVVGTSVLMIERAYGTLLGGAGAGIASRLNAFDDKRAARESSEGVSATSGPRPAP